MSKKIRDKESLTTKETFEDISIKLGINWNKICEKFLISRDRIIAMQFGGDIVDYQQQKIDRLEKLFKNQGGCIKSGLEMQTKIDQLEKENAKLKAGLNHCGGQDEIIEDLEKENQSLQDEICKIKGKLEFAHIDMSDMQYELNTLKEELKKGERCE